MSLDTFNEHVLFVLNDTEGLNPESIPEIPVRILGYEEEIRDEHGAVVAHGDNLPVLTDKYNEWAAWCDQHMPGFDPGALAIEAFLRSQAS